MSIITTIAGAAAGNLWKVAALGLAAALVVSNAAIGYQWHGAASARDTAVLERATAERARDVATARSGELTAHIGTQNKSIERMEAQTAAAQAQAEMAMTMFAPIRGRLDALAKLIAGQAPSATCDQALAKQRAAIDGLRSAQ